LEYRDTKRKANRSKYVNETEDSGFTDFVNLTHPTSRTLLSVIVKKGRSKKRKRKEKGKYIQVVYFPPLLCIRVSCSEGGRGGK